MSVKKIALTGSILGTTGAFLGSMLFLLVEIIRKLITRNDYTFDAMSTGLAFLFLLFVTLFPSMVGGIWLALMLHKDCLQQLNNFASSAKKGMFTGAAASVVSNFFVLILTNGRGSAGVYALYLFETTFIGALFGTATGLILKSIFLRNTRYFTSNKT